MFALTSKLILASVSSLFILGGIAQAEVKAPGTFVPSQCGQQQVAIEDTQSITQVCVGRIAGADEVMAFSFAINDGTYRTLRVAQTANFMIALRNDVVKSVFQLVDDEGTEHTMKVARSNYGGLISISGDLNGVPYLVTNFEAVFTTQSL